MSEPNWGYVYIFGGEGLYKVGFAKDVQSRIGHFPKMPFPCRLVYTIPTDDMRKLERAFHERYKEKRVNGEWFRFSEDDLLALGSLPMVNHASENELSVEQPDPEEEARRLADLMTEEQVREVFSLIERTETAIEALFNGGKKGRLIHVSELYNRTAADMWSAKMSEYLNDASYLFIGPVKSQARRIAEAVQEKGGR